MRRNLVLATIALLLAPVVSAQDDRERGALISAERIFDRAEHSAFTDLLRHGDALFCAFREGSDTSRDGTERYGC